jgi:type II secretory pathway predicted ATPase ExeA
MIEAALNLRSMPFSKEIKVKDLLETGPRLELLARLEHLRKHRGLFLLTGGPGTGKTTALRGWIEALAETSHKVVYVPLTTVSPYDLFLFLNDELAGQPAHRKSKLFANLQAAIRDCASQARRLPVLILDDAHHLPTKTLLELPMLLNFQMDSFDPMLVILSGHEQLAARLRSPLLRHLDQRITLRFEMTSLDEATTRTYLEHRLRLAGAPGDLLEPSAVTAIFQVTHGVPRLIDRITTDALTLTALDHRRQVRDEDVYHASKSI